MPPSSPGRNLKVCDWGMRMLPLGPSWTPAFWPFGALHSFLHPSKVRAKAMVFPAPPRGNHGQSYFPFDGLMLPCRMPCQWIRMPCNGLTRVSNSSTVREDSHQLHLHLRTVRFDITYLSLLTRMHIFSPLHPEINNQSSTQSVLPGNRYLIKRQPRPHSKPL